MEIRWAVDWMLTGEALHFEPQPEQLTTVELEILAAASGLAD